MTLRKHRAVLRAAGKTRMDQFTFLTDPTKVNPTEVPRFLYEIAESSDAHSRLAVQRYLAHAKHRPLRTLQ